MSICLRYVCMNKCHPTRPIKFSSPCQFPKVRTIPPHLLHFLHHRPPSQTAIFHWPHLLDSSPTHLLKYTSRVQNLDQVHPCLWLHQYPFVIYFHLRHRGGEYWLPLIQINVRRRMLMYYRLVMMMVVRYSVQ